MLILTILWRQDRTPNNTYIGQVKILKFTKINKQIILGSAKQTLDLTFKYLFC